MEIPMLFTYNWGMALRVTPILISGNCCGRRLHGQQRRINKNHWSLLKHDFVSTEIQFPYNAIIKK
jgi:hypothetical protein